MAEDKIKAGFHSTRYPAAVPTAIAGGLAPGLGQGGELECAIASVTTLRQGWDLDVRCLMCLMFHGGGYTKGIHGGIK